MRTPLVTRADSESHGIDLAPMLDFVVNLLIFFIITAVFVTQGGVTVNRPTIVSSGVETPSKSVVIDERGEISLDAQAVDIRALRAHVEQYRATSDRAIAQPRSYP